MNVPILNSSLSVPLLLNITLNRQGLVIPPRPAGARLSTAGAEQTFWTPLAIQYGVTVSHDSDVKCCVKAEVMGYNMNALGRGPEHPNRQSGH